jgi:hypothetical protein
LTGREAAEFKTCSVVHQVKEQRINEGGERHGLGLLQTNKLDGDFCIFTLTWQDKGSRDTTNPVYCSVLDKRELIY